MKTTSKKSNYFQKYELVRDPFPIDHIDNVLYLTPELTHRLDQIIAAVTESEKSIVVTSAAGAGKSVLSDYLKSTPKPGWSMSLIQAESTMDIESMAQEIIKQVDPEKAVEDKAKATHQLHKYLEQSAKETIIPVIIIDDAHKLSFKSLEFVLQLSELRYGESLFRIILFADENLSDQLADPKLEDLVSGMVLNMHLPSLSEEKTKEYIDNRLSSCGEINNNPFTENAIKGIYNISGGLPKGINMMARQTMMDEIKQDSGRTNYLGLIAGAVIVFAVIPYLYFTFFTKEETQTITVVNTITSQDDMNDEPEFTSLVEDIDDDIAMENDSRNQISLDLDDMDDEETDSTLVEADDVNESILPLPSDSNVESVSSIMNPLSSTVDVEIEEQPSPSIITDAKDPISDNLNNFE